MNKLTLLIHIFLFFAFSVKGYRIEINNQALAGMPVFLAGYYGDRISVIDSTMTDAGGNAVFERRYDLCAGMYTIVIPGKLQYDLLLDAEQDLRLEWSATGDVSITGDEKTVAWTEYQAFADKNLDREQLAGFRRQIIEKYPDSFLASYLTALQPVTPPETDIADDVRQFMIEYRYLRRNFFANMLLSDVRFLRTPIYHETLDFYFSQFVTQHSDSLIFIAFAMLEQASKNYETFFYMSDFLINFGIRNSRNISNINRFYNFIQRNRDMLGPRGISMLPPRSGANYFEITDEKSLQNRLANMPMTDVDGNAFDQQTIDGNYRVYFFWRNDCARCIAETSRWQNILNRNANLSWTGIAVNVENDVLQQENRILAYDPLCVNVSIADLPACQTYFFASNYSKIILTDNVGNIIGLFNSTASLEDYLRIANM